MYLRRDQTQEVGRVPDSVVFCVDRDEARGSVPCYCLLEVPGSRELFRIGVCHCTWEGGAIKRALYLYVYVTLILKKRV